jgi:hemoglobin
MGQTLFEKQPLFEKIGGFPKVRKIVMVLYDGVLASPRLAPYFDGLDMPKLIDHQMQFVCMLLGGPVAYTGRELKDSHAGLKIRQADFDEMNQLFKAALEDAGMEAEDVARGMFTIGGFRSDLVTV